MSTRADLGMPVFSSEFTGSPATFQPNITNIRHFDKNMIFDENDLVNVFTFLEDRLWAVISS
ncbi:hypothetical protein HBDW_21620 [Herbaspirillum sp. DW155]|uniref:hypothetical protein n=1 Tax=Herbaspirillum sp. DW155 TaxID=3095609 RepID=UPI00308B25C8|nr:hypothetical protein HBDW_21620 [Herbaspirillum sp. DW155]